MGGQCLSLIRCLFMAVLPPILLSTSCAPVPAPTEKDLVAKGLLLGEPCGPPCWQDLVPGVTTEEEARESLQTSGYADAQTVYYDEFAGTRIVRWQRKWVSSQWNEFDIQNGLLEVMILHVDSEVTLEQLLSTYGPPDKFQAGLPSSGPLCVMVDLFYADVGMMVGVNLPADNPELGRETKLVKVRYFEPAPLQEAIAMLQGKKGQPLEAFELEWLTHWRDWHGYGIVKPTY